MTRQTTIGRTVRLSGRGLHTARTGVVTLHPAATDHGRRIVAADRLHNPVPITWTQWVPSRMSTSITIDGDRTIRTLEHMMAALTAHGVDNVLIEVDGPEIPIFDGSAARWCAALRDAEVVTLDEPRRAIRLRTPVQVARDGGFLRAEPAPHFEVDVTHDVLPGFPVMRWRGRIDAPRFDRELARARSFGHLRRRLGLAPAAAPRPATDSVVAPNAPDPAVTCDETPWHDIANRQTRTVDGPLLTGWRPWRATVIVGSRVLPWPRFPDEPVRHVTLDMIGDLAFAGLPLIARIVAHNPSHEKTFALVCALMNARNCWDVVTVEKAGSSAAA